MHLHSIKQSVHKKNRYGEEHEKFTENPTPMQTSINLKVNESIERYYSEDKQIFLGVAQVQLFEYLDPFFFFFFIVIPKTGLG